MIDIEKLTPEQREIERERLELANRCRVLDEYIGAYKKELKELLARQAQMICPYKVGDLLREESGRRRLGRVELVLPYGWGTDVKDWKVILRLIKKDGTDSLQTTDVSGYAYTNKRAYAWNGRWAREDADSEVESGA